jgi:hypothetical protein
MGDGDAVDDDDEVIAVDGAGDDGDDGNRGPLGGGV